MREQDEVKERERERKRKRQWENRMDGRVNGCNKEREKENNEVGGRER